MALMVRSCENKKKYAIALINAWVFEDSFVKFEKNDKKNNKYKSHIYAIKRTAVLKSFILFVYIF